MKTTIDIPGELVRRAKIRAAENRSTLRQLVIEGLESVLGEQRKSTATMSALDRLRRGLDLEPGETLSREELHVR